MFISVGERLVGYEIVEYRGIAMGVGKSSEGFRELAVKKLSDNAMELGANAVINMSMEIYPISDTVQEATAYGDAVLLKKQSSSVLLGDEEKPKIKLDAYVPKQKSNISVGKMMEVNGYKFVVCPDCNTKYKVGVDSDGNTHIKGFDDSDTSEPGLQIFCLKCGTKFTVPES